MVESWLTTLPGLRRSTRPALFLEQACCVSNNTFACKRSAAARKRNQVARGTRKAYSAGRLPISSTMQLNPPACSSRSLTLALVPGATTTLRLRPCHVPGGTPQRIHRSRERSTPMAAADSGCSVSETSIQAHTLPSWVIPATNASASEVRPEHSGPTISLSAPTGNPPCSSASISRIPVGATGEGTRGRGVSAEGILAARLASIWARRC